MAPFYWPLAGAMARRVIWLASMHMQIKLTNRRGRNANAPPRRCRRPKIKPLHPLLDRKLFTGPYTETLLNMSANLTGLNAILILMLSGCASMPSTRPTISPDLMLPPCKISNSAVNSDDDLQADIATAECAARLRTNIYRWQAYYKSIYEQ